jgi:ribosome-binding factor A
MVTVNRIVRVNELLKRELSNLISAKNIAPSNSVFISVSEVKTTNDLRKALIFISVFGGDENTKNDILQLLKRKRIQLQHDVSQVITLKFTPVFRFILDDRIAEGDKIFELLDDSNKDTDE